MHMLAGSAGTPISSVAPGNATMPWPTDGDSGSVSGSRVFTLFVATLQRLVTSRASLLGISAQVQGMGVPVSNSMPVFA